VGLKHRITIRQSVALVVATSIIGLLLSFAIAQYATNGQQIVFGGIRVYALEIEGLNWENKTSLWKADRIPARGQTMIWTEGWWWNGSVTIRGKLQNNRKFECKTGRFHAGFVIGLVIAKPDGTCFGEQGNNAPEAKRLEQWLMGRMGSQQIEAVKAVLETADDAWQCVNTLVTNSTFACSGVSPLVIQRLR
jgi:hypothetical protein